MIGKIWSSACPYKHCFPCSAQKAFVLLNNMHALLVLGMMKMEGKVERKIRKKDIKAARLQKQVFHDLQL